MNIWTLFKKEEQVEDMDSPLKGRIGQRYEPSSNKGVSRLIIWILSGKGE